jgi:hypothetical protein
VLLLGAFVPTELEYDSLLTRAARYRQDRHRHAPPGGGASSSYGVAQERVVYGDRKAISHTNPTES